MVFARLRLAARNLPRLIGQAEHALGDDVELDLRGATLDRVAARAQPLPRQRDLVVVSRALPAEPLRARDPHRQLMAVLVELGGVDLEQRALGAGPVPGLRGVAAALHGEVE